MEEQFRLKPKEKKKILNAKNIGSTIQQILCNYGVKFKKSLVNVLQDKLNSSMSEVKDSMLMWSHYAQNHTGFCIEYEFETNDKFDIFLHQVEYTKDRYIVSKSDISNKKSDWIYKTTCCKSDVWSYEKEWRIVINNFDKMMPQNLKSIEEKYVLNLKAYIKSFYLGAKIAENFKKEIIEFGQKNNIHVYQMVLSPNTYDLEAEKII